MMVFQKPPYKSKRQGPKTLPSEQKQKPKCLEYSNLLRSASEKEIYGNLQNIRESNKLYVGNESYLTLKLRETGCVHVHSVYLKLCKKLFLLHAFFLSGGLNTGADKVTIS